MRKHILFDLDGTLTDPMIGITSSVQYALSRFGIEVRYLKDLIPFIGPPLMESFEKYYGLTPDQARTAVDYYREYFSPTGIYENEIYPGIERMLQTLKEAGFSLYVATSKPEVYARRILEYFKIGNYFSYVGGSELDGSRVQKNDVIAHVLWECGIPAADAIMVGDRRHDIEGARSCGLFSVGVLFGYGSEDELKRAGASRIVATVDELSDFLLGQDQEKEDHSLIRFGIVGTGKRAEDFFLANRFSHGFELTAVYDEDIKKAEDFAFRKGKVELYDDIDQFAACDHMDAVFVSGPAPLHHDQAIRLMQAGKHVLCQMPLAMTREEAEDMFETARREDVILLEAVYPVYTPAFESMVRYMDSLGEVRQAILQNCRRTPDYDRLRRTGTVEAFDPDMGGALFGSGVCPVACMTRLFGEPKQVTAAGVRLDSGADGAGTIVMDYGNMVGTVVYSSISNAAVPSQIQGEEASMLIREIENLKDLRIFRSKVDQTIHFDQSDNTMHHVTRKFMKMIRTGTGWEEARDHSLVTAGVLEKAAECIHQKED